MKKVLLTLSLFSIGLSWGQRQMDISAQITSPANNSEVEINQPVNFNVQCTNNGPAAIEENDSLFVYVEINGEPVIFQPANSDHVVRTGNAFPSGATFNIFMPMMFSNGYENTTNEICITVVPVNAADEIQDPEMSDNTDCISFTVVENNAGIGELDAATIGLSPNPATASFSITGVEGNAAFTVTDLNGKLFLSGNVSSSAIDCSSLANGYYTVQIQQNETVIMKRLIINH